MDIGEGVEHWQVILISTRCQRTRLVHLVHSNVDCYMSFAQICFRSVFLGGGNEPIFGIFVVMARSADCFQSFYVLALNRGSIEARHRKWPNLPFLPLLDDLTAQSTTTTQSFHHFAQICKNCKVYSQNTFDK